MRNTQILCWRNLHDEDAALSVVVSPCHDATLVAMYLTYMVYALAHTQEHTLRIGDQRERKHFDCLFSAVPQTPTANGPGTLPVSWKIQLNMHYSKCIMLCVCVLSCARVFRNTRGVCDTCTALKVRIVFNLVFACSHTSLFFESYGNHTKIVRLLVTRNEMFQFGGKPTTEIDFDSNRTRARQYM